MCIRNMIIHVQKTYVKNFNAYSKVVYSWCIKISKKIILCFFFSFFRNAEFLIYWLINVFYFLEDFLFIVQEKYLIQKKYYAKKYYSRAIIFYADFQVLIKPQLLNHKYSPKRFRKFILLTDIPSFYITILKKNCPIKGWNEVYFLKMKNAIFSLNFCYIRFFFLRDDESFYLFYS